MKKYFLKPVVVEAERWTGGRDIEGVCEQWHYDGSVFQVSGTLPPPHHVHTISGTKMIHPGDWIVKNAEGGLAVCNDAMFTELYEVL